MSTDTLENNLSDADVPGSTNCMIRPISHPMEQQGQPFLRPRNASDLIAQHPELVANLMASLNPTPPPLAHDVLLFQSAVADIQQAALDGILTSAEATLLIAAVIEGFTTRRAVDSVSSAFQAVFSAASK